MAIEFTLPLKWLDPKNPEHVLLIANRIAAIRYGGHHKISPAEMQDNDTVSIDPNTNDHWLVPPGRSTQDEKTWRLVARYDTNEDLELIVQVLKKFL